MKLFWIYTTNALSLGNRTLNFINLQELYLVKPMRKVEIMRDTSCFIDENFRVGKVS